jgi:hypothetical protein
MMDTIDKRNRRQAIASNTIKWWTVNYLMDEEAADEKHDDEVSADDDSHHLSEEEEKLAHDIVERLEHEAQEDEERKSHEWEEKVQNQMSETEAYNKATGSYSGYYGQQSHEMDDGMKDQVQGILSQHDLNVDELMDELDG